MSHDQQIKQALTPVKGTRPTAEGLATRMIDKISDQGIETFEQMTLQALEKGDDFEPKVRDYPREALNNLKAAGAVLFQRENGLAGGPLLVRFTMNSWFWIQDIRAGRSWKRS